MDNAKETGKGAFDDAVNWEASRILMIERSERRAWKVALIAVVCAVMLLIGIVVMLPLKETVPYVVRVDSATGIPDIVTALDVKSERFDEVMDKYWLALYVRARETFDWYTLQKDYDTVGLLSSPQVGAEYGALFEGKDALDKKYGTSVKITAEIVSVVPNGRGIGTVRFRRIARRVDDQNAPKEITSWVATIGYEFRNPSLIPESQRMVNPFGFQVLSYRVDPEMGGK